MKTLFLIILLISFSCNNEYFIDCLSLYERLDIIEFNYENCHSYYNFKLDSVSSLDGYFLYTSSCTDLSIEEFPSYCKNFMIDRLNKNLYAHKCLSVKLTDKNTLILSKLILPNLKYLSVSGRFLQFQFPSMKSLKSFTYYNDARNNGFYFTEKITHVEMLHIGTTDFFDFKKNLHYARRLKYLIVTGSSNFLHSSFIPKYNRIEYIIISNNYDFMDMDHIVGKCRNLKKIVLMNLSQNFHSNSIFKKYKNNEKFIFYNDFPEIGSLLQLLSNPLLGPKSGELLNW
ncbi:hypothetical protein KKF34_00610 [Myxococcota bacterium]|nr:hypothetical protein [Myxococcota bacterium]MBU1379706.1 hypothetical protein [Myxococcota bacterium]MBU1495363.1 hypothetical protein [Myxococcota bacterium]